MRDMIAHVAQLQGFDMQKAEHLKSVVDELCNNAIEHGSQPTSEVVLEIHSDDKAIKITCLDQGHGNKLSAEELQKKITEGVKEGDVRGRGMPMIVKSFVDELEVKDRKEGGLSITTILYKEGKKSEETRK